MKKNKVFVNKINKVKNNQVSCEVEEGEVVLEPSLTVTEKLDKLFNTNGYIFNVNVKIVTDNKTYDTKIANRIGNNIITMDNDIICIKKIKDIIF